MSKLGEKTLFSLIVDTESMRTLATEGLPSVVIPDEELQKIYEWALRYWDDGGRDADAAPSVEVLKETDMGRPGEKYSMYEVLVLDNEIDLDELPDETIEWAIQDLRATYISRRMQEWSRESILEVVSALPDQKYAALVKITNELAGITQELDPANVSNNNRLPEPIDWDALWLKAAPEDDFLIAPLIAKGRATAICSVAKTGKSLLLLDAVAAAVTGRSVFGQDPTEPIRVVYLDLEMTEEDVRERLQDMGYGKDDDLSGLAYYLLPNLPPLDTAEGGMVLEALATEHRADLVVVDTMARAVCGPEDKSDTYRDFFRSTGRRLKALGITLVRLDHQGKDASKGQRGSSGKNDDVDVVFQLSVSGKTVTLKNTHSRVKWVAKEIQFTRDETDTLRHLTTIDGYPEGTIETANLMNDLNVPLEATTAEAIQLLKEAGHGKRKETVLAAVRFRKTGQRILGNRSQTIPSEESGNR